MREFICFIRLVQRDLYILKSYFFQFLIEGGIAAGCFYLLYACFLPAMGMTPRFVPAMFMGSLVSNMIPVIFSSLQQVAIDLEKHRYIEYIATLPISNALIILRFILSMTLGTLICWIPVCGCGALLFHAFLRESPGSLSTFLIIAFLLLFAVCAITTAIVFFFSYTWFNSYMWVCGLMPLIFFGCEIVPWRDAYRVAPYLATLFLLNPVTYGIEGMRSVITGSPHYIPTSVCIPVLLLWSFIGYFGALYSFNKRMGR